MHDAMSDAASRLNAALEGRYAIERELGEGGMATVYLELPANAYFMREPFLALAADGSTIVVEAHIDGDNILLQRPLDELAFTPIQGTENAFRPMMSPIGQEVAFSRLSSSHRVQVSGGTVIDIGPRMGFGGDWGADDTIYYAPRYNSGLWRVSSIGGTPSQITAPDSLEPELGHWWPQVLPDGEHLIFTSYRTPVDSARIMAVSLSTGDLTMVQEEAYFARYSPTGHLLFVRGQALWAVEFDPVRLTTTGSPPIVIDGIAADPTSGRASYALVDNGIFVYAAAEDFYVPSQLVSIDRASNVETELPL
jgi:hypothetical protein